MKIPGVSEEKRNFGEWVAYFLSYPSYCIAFLFHWSPPFVKRFAGRCLGLLWFDVLRIRRKVAIDNVLLAFPEYSKKQATSLARESLYHMGLTVFDFFSFPFVNRKSILKTFEFEGIEHLEEALKKGKGVCSLSLHLGNGDYGGAALAQYGFDVHIITKLFKTRWFNRLVYGFRYRLGVKVLPPRKCSPQIMAALADNHTVIFVMDQYTGLPIGLKTKFFGHTTGTAAGLAVFSKKSDAIVLPIYTFRKDVHRHVLRIEPPIEPIEGATKEESLQLTTQAYNDHLEKVIREHPEQWMWIHRRWKPGFE